MSNTKKESYCGMICSACAIYLASQEEPEMLRATADRLRQSVEETACKGCKSDKVSMHCLHCKIRICAKTKEVDCCSECEEYPCEMLLDFQRNVPKRSEQRKLLREIGEKDFDAWYQDFIERYSCQKRGIVPQKACVQEHLKKVRKYFGISEGSQ